MSSVVNKDACIVIIDDDDDIRNLLKNRFIKAEFRVGSSKSAEAGISVISEMYPDLIIADINLPGMTGVDLLRKLNFNHQLKKIPVIMLSSNTDKATVLSCLQAGAKEYFVKPVDLDLLIQKSIKLIGQYREEKVQPAPNVEPVVMARHMGVCLFVLKAFPNKDTVIFFKQLANVNFKTQTLNDVFIIDLRSVNQTGPVMQKFLQAIIQLFSHKKIKFLPGRHYTLLMELVEDMEDQLFLSVADLEEALGNKLPDTKYY